MFVWRAVIELEAGIGGGVGGAVDESRKDSLVLLSSHLQVNRGVQNRDAPQPNTSRPRI